MYGIDHNVMSVVCAKRCTKSRLLLRGQIINQLQLWNSIVELISSLIRKKISFIEYPFRFRALANIETNIETFYRLQV